MLDQVRCFLSRAIVTVSRMDSEDWGRKPLLLRSTRRHYVGVAPTIWTSKLPIQSAEDLRFKEWSECRTVVARLDTILVDLRKTGFAFVTALLTASTFLSLLGVPGASNATATPVEARGAAFIAIMVLIAALFAVDNYYDVLLSAAVERALDLETQMKPPVRLTKYLSFNAANTFSTWVTLLLYLILLGTAGGLGLLAVTNTTSGQTFGMTWNSMAWAVSAVGGVLLLLTIAYWYFVAARTGYHRRKASRQWPRGESPNDKIAQPPDPSDEETAPDSYERPLSP